MAVVSTATRAPAALGPERRGMTAEERRAVVGSSLGAVFEWYDFYLYASLAPVLGRHFFTPLDESTQFLLALAAFSAAFIVRPFGALVFGRLGDLAGRKHAFLLTVVLMGSATTAVGLLPDFGAIGPAAPVLLVAFRVLQGLALGGEYGGAATYVAEHAPRRRRGLFTSWIQATATAGLLLSLLAVVAARAALGARFEAWGWRLPFLGSAALLAISVYIRVRLQESPVFRRMRDAGRASRAPLTESFLEWRNLRVMLLVLFGAVAGQAVVWYTGMVHPLFFLIETLKVPATQATLMLAAALALATPFFVVFGALSDRFGRKRIVTLGCVLAAASWFPAFRLLTKAANPAIFEAARSQPVTVVADHAECSLQLDPIGRKRFSSSCDVARGWLARNAVPYRSEAAPSGTVASVRVGETVVHAFDGMVVATPEFRERSAAFDRAMTAAIRAAGYPAAADPARIDVPLVVGILFLLALYVTMTYGPMAAWLVELFPARVRYTSLSVPYHIGNGWFGGLVPTVAFALVAATGDVYYGLWYPFVVAVSGAVVGTLFVPETKDREIHHEA